MSTQTTVPTRPHRLPRSCPPPAEPARCLTCPPPCRDVSPRPGHGSSHGSPPRRTPHATSTSWPAYSSRDPPQSASSQQVRSRIRRAAQLSSGTCRFRGCRERRPRARGVTVRSPSVQMDTGRIPRRRCSGYVSTPGLNDLSRILLQSTSQRPRKVPGATRSTRTGPPTASARSDRG